VSRPVARYRPSRRYLLLLLFAALGAVLSVWSGLQWPVVWIAAVGFAISGAAVLALVLRPSIEIHESHLQVGRRSIPWRAIRRLDRTGWNAPLVMRLTILRAMRETPRQTLRKGARTVAGTGVFEENLTLIYPGDLDSSTSLLRHLRRYSKEALLDGVPYAQYWGEPSTQAAQAVHAPQAIQTPQPPSTPVRYPLLRPEDEDEVEQMFQRLKAAGRIEQRGPDEK
jgi:hypothetical protein